MGERRGTKALELWCRRITEGYPGVKIDNMTTSWRDGLAFCAMIHKFRPDLIDFSKLNKNDVYHNNELAFRTAERHLGIPALLDAEDMVEFPVPDRLSILTYLSQFYQVFVGSQGTPTRIVPKRPATTAGGIVSPASPSPAKKMAVRSGGTGGIGRREPCLKCGMPVFLAERLNVGKHLYHRTCFRCARCNNQLSLANYYETETDGQYCCETCPDEEAAKLAKKPEIISNHPMDEVLKKSPHSESEDAYSTDFETALELPLANLTGRSEASVYSNARSQFISQIVDQNAKDEVKPPDLPKSKPPDDTEHTLVRQDSNKSVHNNEDNTFSLSSSLVHSSSDSKENQPKTASDLPCPTPVTGSDTEVAVIDNIETKDVILNSSSTISGSNTSLVKARLKLFDSGGNNAKPKDNNVSDTNKALSLGTVQDDERMEIDTEISSTNQVPSAEDLVTRLDKDDNYKRSDLYASLSDVDIENVREDKAVELSYHEENREDALLDETIPIVSPVDVSNTKGIADVEDSNKDVSNIIKSNTEKNDKEEESDISELIYSKEKISEAKDDKIIKDEVLVSVSLEESLDTSKKSDIIITDDQTGDAQTEDNTSSKVTESIESLRESAITISSNDSQQESVISIISSTDEQSAEISKPIELDDSAVIISSDSENQSNVENSATHIIEEEPKVEKEPLTEDVVVPEIQITRTPSVVEKVEATESKESDYPEDLNPFDDEEGEGVGELTPRKPVPAKRKIKPFPIDEKLSGLDQDTPEELKALHVRRLPSLNPFGDSEDEEEDTSASLPPTSGGKKKILAAPKISFNPFWSDGEEPDDEEENKGKPTPTPRTSRNVGTPETRPRLSNLSAGSNTGGFYGSSSSISSLNSSLGYTPGRKKKQAPPPPHVLKASAEAAASSSAKNSQSSSPATSVQSSPKSLKHRKNRKAPPPPTSTPMVNQKVDPYASITTIAATTSPPFSPIDSPLTEEAKLQQQGWEIEKTNKDERNRNRQSQGETGIPSDNILVPDKSTFGKWKRKKGPAPSRPVPQRRSIKAMPVEEVKKELEIIELQQQGLEKQGVRLEQIIRDRCENANVDPDTATDPEVEDLVLQLFELVNEKNELFRKQAELMYLRRQQRLEEEHADLEYQIRCLMEQPEANKTDSDKAREEELIKRLVDVVERRNEVVECLEMDRVRENQEDDSISSHLSLLALKREEESLEKSMDSFKIEEKQKEKEKKKQKKDKKFKLKNSSSKLDADKDIDESESSSTTDTMKKKKKKWFS